MPKLINIIPLYNSKRIPYCSQAVQDSFSQNFTCRKVNYADQPERSAHSSCSIAAAPDSQHEQVVCKVGMNSEIGLFPYEVGAPIVQGILLGGGWLATLNKRRVFFPSENAKQIPPSQLWNLR